MWVLSVLTGSPAPPDPFLPPDARELLDLLMSGRLQEDDAFQVALFLYHLLAHGYFGQRSEGYQLLCALLRLPFEPGHKADRLHPDEDRGAIDLLEAFGQSWTASGEDGDGGSE